MDKKKYLVEGLSYQILWIITSSILFVILFKIIDFLIIRDIDTEKKLNKFYDFYFNVGKPILLLLGVVIILLGIFIIQKKRFYKYNKYFESGLKYLKNDGEDLIPFHESLSEERKLFLELYNHHRRIEKEYEIAYKEKTDLLTYLAHDIKTPLANMIGYITLLNDEKNLSEEQKRKFINIIYDNVKYLNRLSEEFFLYLKFNLNEVPLNFTNVNIEIFFRQWEEERSLSIEDHVLVLEFLDMEDAEMQIDSQLLLRVMENLITNAVNYSVKGTAINIKVAVVEGLLIISIINKVEKNLNVNWNMVTSKFYRGDLSRKMGDNGSGLGLTIVNDIVKHLGGNFEIGETDSIVCAKVSIPCKQK